MKRKLKVRFIMIACFISIVLFRAFLYEPHTVIGDSMLPTYKQGYRLVSKKYDIDPLLGDVVIVNDMGAKMVKRITGIEGDTIHIGDGTYELRAGEYYVQGDNLKNTYKGIVSREQVIGIVIWQLYPVFTLTKAR